MEPIKCHQYKRLILMAVIRWLVEDFSFILIRSSFFVTDTSRTNSELFFYLKSDWKTIFKLQLNDPITKNYKTLYNLEKIRENDAIGYCDRFESNGIHLGRLLPKNIDNECRIISGCRVLNPSSKKVFNVNYRYIALNNCLKWLIKNDPTLIGFACVGHKDIQRKYVAFLNLNSMNRYFSFENNFIEPFKKWNFMKCDIQKCFDSIDINELRLYVNDLFDKRLGII